MIKIVFFPQHTKLGQSVQKLRPAAHKADDSYQVLGLCGVADPRVHSKKGLPLKCHCSAVVHFLGNFNDSEANPQMLLCLRLKYQGVRTAAD